MAKVAEFGIFPVFITVDGTLSVQPEMLFPTEEEAKRAAEVFAGVLGGAVAFTRMADREAGLVEDGVIIARYGVMARDSVGQTAEEPDVEALKAHAKAPHMLAYGARTKDMVANRTIHVLTPA